jgi:chromosome segregation ATPase
MENLTGILSLAIIILVLLVWWLNWRLKTITASVDKNRQEIQKIAHDLEITRGKFNQMNTIDLDFSAMENKIEENTQQLLSYVRQEIGEINDDIRDLEEAVNNLEESLENMNEQENKEETDVSN